MTATTPYVPLAPEGELDVELKKLSEHNWPFPEALGRKTFSEDLPGGPIRNAYRASYVTGALAKYASRVAPGGSEPLETIIRDLLSDLMHLCDLLVPDEETDETWEWTFSEMAERAARNYHAEVAGE